MANEVETKTKTEKPRSRRARVGRVISISGRATACVELDSLVKHQQYGKYIHRRTKLSVHDEHGKAQVGDVVEIVPSRRVSKTKAHRLVRIVRAAERVEA